jgi:hypothetical protein
MMKSPIYGLVAEFSEPEQILHAAERAKEEGYRRLDAYTPFPVHGLAEALEFHDPKVPWMIFIAGVIGASAGYGLQLSTATPLLEPILKKLIPITGDVVVRNLPYPMNVGGRPFHSWPSFIPVTYELTILFASLAAFFGTLYLNGMPRPYHSIFNAPNFERASQDKFFLCIEAVDPQFNIETTATFLQSLGADAVSEVEQ